MKSNIVLQMDIEDFEALSNSYMAFDESWDDQIKNGRFENIKLNPGFSVIYWFDNAVSLILAKTYLKSIGQDFKELYDINLDGYSIITNFDVSEVANAS
jgi:hypothetical protein